MDLYLGIVGSGSAGELDKLAYEVGRYVAQNGAILVCGGLGGVMAAACKGAKEAGGRTLGILPGDDRKMANAWVDLSVVTGMGQGRNVLVARSSDALIALPGESGTLSEVALALKMGKPVIALSAWADVRGTLPSEDPAEAVQRAISSIEGIS